MSRNAACTSLCLNIFLYYALSGQSVEALLLSRAHTSRNVQSIPKCRMEMTTSSDTDVGRRSLLLSSSAWIFGSGMLFPSSASAVVYLDPAMYGDQENRVAAVDSLREAVRRAILQNPKLAPSFYNLAILDGLSYDIETKAGGPDGNIVRKVLSSNSNDPFVDRLKECCETLLAAKDNLKRKTAITLADAVAIGGAEAIESIGGPVISVQLGRTDAPKGSELSPLPIDLLSGGNPDEVVKAFRRSGLTEREMTALLGALLTVDEVTKGMSAVTDWKKSQRAKFVEPGKLGRMSDFKRLTDEDIAEMEEDEEDSYTDNEDLYIADTFGTRDQAFGSKIGDKISEKNFNLYLKELSKKGTGDFGWIGSLLTDDKKNPAARTMLAKYASSPLIYNKDLSIAFNSITQLGAEYTGGKYESLLKGKPRKSLN
jgi:hypothetical protein